MFQQLLVGTMLLLSLAAWSKDCRVDPQDSYEVDAKIGQGRFAGECLDTSAVRSYQILNQAQINPFPALGEMQRRGAILVANFFHDKKFYIAAIFPQELRQIIFQLERFPPEWLAAHTQLRFVFSRAGAIVLFDQKKPDLPLVELKDMVLSVEAVFMRQGPSYDLWKGLHGYFGMAHRLLSMQQRYDESVRQFGHTVEQILLMPEDQLLKDKKNWQAELLISVLMRLEKPQMDSLYHTLKVNCTNTLFRALDYFFDYEKEHGGGISATWPIFSQAALKKRHLIQGVSFLETLNREYDRIYHYEN